MNPAPLQPDLGIWEIAVLALLREEPMHPYQMRRLLKTRHKDEILALKHGSLYHAIRRLERDGLIAVEGTTREGRRPERTTYRLTPAGHQALLATLRHIVATPRRESSDFMAAMSFLVHLDPAEAAARLAERVAALEQTVAAYQAALTAASAHVERINLVESEYLLAMLRAELAWTQALHRDLAGGTLRWSLDEVLSKAASDRETARKIARKQEA